jgi:hypothetical protein
MYCACYLGGHLYNFGGQDMWSVLVWFHLVFPLHMKPEKAGPTSMVLNLLRMALGNNFFTRNLTWKCHVFK